MVTFSVCLETVITGLPVAERIGRIREAGFDRVEFWHPEGTWDGEDLRRDLPKSPSALREACQAHGVRINDFAFHAWDGSIGGCPVRPGDREPFLGQVRRMAAFAQAVGCEKGIVLSGTADPALSKPEMRRRLEAALVEAVAIARAARVFLLLEPLNTRVDHPGYYLDSSKEAVEVIRAIGSPHLKLLYDVYHMQIMEGNLLSTIERHLDVIGHFHSAGVPGRAELFGGELSYRDIVRRLEALGYEGTFGLEYFPRIPDHAESLRRTLEYLRGS